MLREVTVCCRDARRLWVAVPILSALLPLVTASACVYDSDKRCGPNQVLDSTALETCVCDAHSVATATGCTPCGSNEVPSPSGCQCATGYGRASASDPCTLGTVTSSAGASCDPATASCTDAKYNFCFAETGKVAYCTSQRCTSNTDCPDTYACDNRVTPSVCRKPPEGMGKTCSSDTDCAGTEATLCNLFAQTCVVKDCNVTTNDCFPGYTCCDLSKIGVNATVCGQGACP
jgi:hypothetical protein